MWVCVYHVSCVCVSVICVRVYYVHARLFSVCVSIRCVRVCCVCIYYVRAQGALTCLSIMCVCIYCVLTSNIVWGRVDTISNCVCMRVHHVCVYACLSCVCVAVSKSRPDQAGHNRHLSVVYPSFWQNCCMLCIYGPHVVLLPCNFTCWPPAHSCLIENLWPHVGLLPCNFTCWPPARQAHEKLHCYVVSL